MMSGNSIIRTLLFAALTVFAVACSREDAIGDKGELVFTASWADTPVTKTVLQEDGTSVWWTVGEEINLFYGSLASGCFVSTNTQPQQNVSFMGSLGIIETVPNLYWAAYPYNSINTCDGESVTLSLPQGQVAAENTFADKSFPAVARSSTFSLTFHHVCGGARFSVETEGIKRVTFKTAGGESIAGKVRVSYGTDGKPAITVIDGQDNVSVHAPDGVFVPGKQYFVAFLPGTISGLTAFLVREDSYGEKSFRKEITVNRARFGILDHLDRDVVFREGSVPDPSLIQFEDPNIKPFLVNAFDTNGDEELSISEAAAARSLTNVFGNEKGFKSFNEFRYFTGIIGLRETFFNWTQLKSILLPESIESIGEDSFYNCMALTDILLPAALRRIGSHAFFKCGCLSSVSTSVPSALQTIENHAFASCTNLQSIILPDSLRDIGEYAFSKCESISEITIPDGVTSMGIGIFYGCKALSSITLPSGIQLVPERMFQGCSGLKTFTIPSSVTRLGDWAFGDSGLQTIRIPGSIYGIGDSVFGRCYDLTSVTIDEGVQVVGANAFRECTSLETVVLPESIFYLGEYAFAYCPKLTKMILYATTPPAFYYDSYKSESPFEQSDSCLFYVPDDAVDLYKSNEKWKMLADRIFPLSDLT